MTPLHRRVLSLLPVAPLLVVLIGLAAAATIVALGVAQIRRTSDREAQLRATTVAAVMASRLRFTALEDRSSLVAEAAQKGGDIELLLVNQDGQVVADASLGGISREEIVRMLVAGEGVSATLGGRQRFGTRPLGPPLEHLSVIALAAAPETPAETLTLVQAVAALTALLVGVAAAVTFSYARAANDEVALLRERIRKMADPKTEAVGATIPIRALDEVGLLTMAFNTLVNRFIAAEKTYRADLAEAARVDEERLEFLAGLSHELRTPMNAILGFSHVLESGVDGPLSGDARESVEIIRTSGEHLRTLIDDILDLSALESGELKLTKRAVDVRRIAEEVVREATALARHKQLVLRVECDSSVIVMADKRRVRQILTNLVSNAVKFTPPLGSVVVRIWERSRFAEIDVADTGYGVPENERAVIFEAYRQVAGARLHHGGAGLGLATVKRLVELHGGDIKLTSVVSKGSTFSFRLPLATDEDLALTETRVSVTSVLPPEPEKRS
ncbi:MAG: HAMP domain-containing histidine kinase [Myxococcales bacterium]|nr:HAMP domain-containing histidine kinase [Myxococcales bacterium]